MENIIIVPTAMKAIYDKVSGVQNYPGIRDGIVCYFTVILYSINVVFSGLKTFMIARH